MYDRCLCNFSSQERLNSHLDDCSTHNPFRIIFPRNNENILKFRSIRKQYEAPFVIYADFECFTQKIDTYQPNPNFSYMQNYHVPFSVAYQVVCSMHPELSHFRSHSGIDPHVLFLAQLKNEASIFIDYLGLNHSPEKMTIEQQTSHNMASQCYSCCRQFEDISHCKVADRDHTTGKYRETAYVISITDVVAYCQFFFTI